MIEYGNWKMVPDSRFLVRCSDRKHAVGSRKNMKDVNGYCNERSLQECRHDYTVSFYAIP